MTTQEATVVIALIGAVIAFWGVITQRVLARRRATIDHISSLLNDHDYIRARLAFVTLAKSDKGLLPYAEKDPEVVPADAPNAADIQKAHQKVNSEIDLILNNYELIAIGIQRGILDYKIMRLYARAIIIQHWEAAAPYIARLRIARSNPGYYTEFETLKDWMSGAKRKPRGRFWALLF